ncbi:hypothetical protein D3C86_1995170 [compost metagenome]
MGSVLEQMFMIISTDRFLEISKAKSIEGKLGSTVFTFSPENKIALYDLALEIEKLKPRSKPKSPASKPKPPAKKKKK